MKVRYMKILIYFFLFILLVDMYAFKGIKMLIDPLSNIFLKRMIQVSYWLITGAFIVALSLMGKEMGKSTNPQLYKNFYTLGGLFLLVYIPKLVFITFHLVEDIWHVGKYVVFFIKDIYNPSVSGSGQGISRLTFLSRAGVVMAAIPFSGILYGMVKGRFQYRTEHVHLKFTDLPSSFDGIRIVQISDIHIGSYWGHENKVKQAIEQINRENPDIILFTGDLVNNFAQEMEGWYDILGKMRAKIGKFSILGNHDYGDYHTWDSIEAKAHNLEKIKQAHKKIGFDLLLNRHEFIKIGKEQIAIAGVENWGLPPFPQYGDLAKTISGLPENVFTILMSHDPSHWDAEIIKNTTVPLTLSGHTHGMQFGINLPQFKWSPVKYKYPRWAGLYNQGLQYLYVNRGFGYIGYPGRVGMSPEITVFTLSCGDK